ncbi:MAG: hypothetical protein AB1540_12715 [Bdellovibrionota bacterium]
MKVVRNLVMGLLFFCHTLGWSYTITSSIDEPFGDFLKTTMTVQVDSNPLNTFKIVRIREDRQVHTYHGAIILVPGLLNHFGFYEFTSTGDVEDSIAGYLADRKFDVWGISPRETLVESGECATTDCSVMNTWGLQSLVDDITFIRSQVASVHGSNKPVVGGFSLGAIAALATINAHPNDYKGLLLWEGSLYTTDPAVIQRNAQFCAQMEGALSAGVYYDDQNGPFVKLLAQLAASDPNGMSPLPPFAGLTNRQAFAILFTQNQNAPNFPTDQYVQLNGTALPEVSYKYADETGRIYPSIAQGFADTFPIRTVRDVNCGIAGETTFINNLSAFTGDVLMLKSGRGFGPLMTDLSTLLTSAQIRDDLPANDYGHVERYMHENYVKQLLKPMVKWLKQDVF